MPEFELSPSMIQWISFALAFGAGLIIKDLLTNIIQGLLFRFSSRFQEGDHVLFNGENAVIVSIGFRYTKFGIVKEDGRYVWIYCPNDQVKFREIAKVIRQSDEHTNGKHSGTGNGKPPIIKSRKK